MKLEWNYCIDSKTGQRILLANGTVYRVATMDEAFEKLAEIEQELLEADEEE